MLPWKLVPAVKCGVHGRFGGALDRGNGGAAQHGAGAAGADFVAEEQYALRAGGVGPRVDIGEGGTLTDSLTALGLLKSWAELLTARVLICAHRLYVRRMLPLALRRATFPLLERAENAVEGPRREGD